MVTRGHTVEDKGVFMRKKKD